MEDKALDLSYVTKRKAKRSTGGAYIKTHREKARGKRYVFIFEANSKKITKYKDTTEEILATYNRMVKKYGMVIRPRIMDLSGEINKHIKFKDIIE